MADFRTNTPIAVHQFVLVLPDLAHSPQVRYIPW